MIDFTAKAAPFPIHKFSLDCLVMPTFLHCVLLPCQHVATSKGPLTHIAQVVGLIFGKIVKEIIFQLFDHFLKN